ncbi:MAG: hypothetical protein Q4A39_05240, partial [Eubacteriales bacterium]|nr:hypothetical protein [Eubacteriales bacterium]
PQKCHQHKPLDPERLHGFYICKKNNTTGQSSSRLILAKVCFFDKMGVIVRFATPVRISGSRVTYTTNNAFSAAVRAFLQA